MPFSYTPDITALEPEPALRGLPRFTAGAHQTAHDSEIGKEIYRILTSRLGAAMVMGTVIAAPSRPPVVATGPVLRAQIGDAAFTDDMKKYAGRVVRFIVEELGGRWVRRGVKVTVPSPYGSGSIYTFN